MRLTDFQSDFYALSDYAIEWGIADERTYFYLILSDYRTLQKYLSKAYYKAYMPKLSHSQELLTLQKHCQKVNKNGVEEFEQNFQRFRKFMNEADLIYFGPNENKPSSRYYPYN
ncbi:UNKNOWN [Stylonychia lemnae]|uniref:Uncharacterized protein n=1 Tax=Stylonychia lemnae TaxID=5949 RepID=A0A077ZRJ4_STYLE|nr:UNKNOWN [Stylonychia lemnae]|eukprot:CDW71121.1 UNKNOWN [Stylonychia lemnae]